MAKRNSKKKAEKKKETAPVEKRETLQSWGLHDSQLSILMQAQERHKQELLPLQQYHRDQMKRFLVDIAKELGVPDDIQVRLEGNKFVEVKPPPQPSPTTQDLTKVKG